MLGNHLEKKCKVYHAPGDADVLIVQKSVESATLMDTALVGEDTDLLILLCYHAGLESHYIFFRPEPKKNVKKPKVWNIKAVKEQLGSEICSNIPFLHAVLGCDTTSHLYGIGKGTSLKKFKSSRHFQEQAKMFATESATPKEISTAGEQALVILYNGTPGESLDSLRYRRFCEKVSTNTSSLHPQVLPPTSAATKYHSFRVYFQILEWKGIGDIFSLLDWEWKKIDGKFMPVFTDMSPAPNELLKMIRCNCHTDCSSMRCTCRKHNVSCSSMRCTCRKHNVSCSPACGNCRGSGCTNSNNLIHEQENMDNDTE